MDACHSLYQYLERKKPRADPLFHKERASSTTSKGGRRLQESGLQGNNILSLLIILIISTYKCGVGEEEPLGDDEMDPSKHESLYRMPEGEDAYADADADFDASAHERDYMYGYGFGARRAAHDDIADYYLRQGGVVDGRDGKESNR